MRASHCATCVALAAVVAIPADRWLHQPHAHTPSPREQVAYLGSAEAASSNSTSAARTVRFIAPEARHAPHLR